MPEGIKVGKIRRALDTNTRLSGEEAYAKKEVNWHIYDARLESFGKTFFECLPQNKEGYSLLLSDLENKGSEGDVFKQYVEQTLQKEGRRDLTAVEFGGPGSNLFSDFGNFFKKTIGVCLKDIRAEAQKVFDQKHNHFLLVGMKC